MLSFFYVLIAIATYFVLNPDSFQATSKTKGERKRKGKQQKKKQYKQKKR